jgi:hypothetical protein
MTIREFLGRRSWQYPNRTVMFLLVAGALVTTVTHAYITRFICAVVILAVVVAAFSSQFRIPCPNCGKSLGMAGFRAAHAGPRDGSRVPSSCPHCGVSFDDELPKGSKR